MSDDLKPCRICGELPDYAHADLARGESLPPASGELEEIGDGLKKCPACGGYYQYRYVYEYLVYGSDEDAYLERIDRDEVIRRLMHVRELSDKVCRELEYLGVKDAYARIIERLTQALESVDERHYALLTLVDHYLSTNRAKLDGLLEYPDSWIRSQTLYFLMTRQADEVARFVKRLSDPVADVRNHAAWALRSRADRRGDISAAMAALIATLAGDPVLDVRRQAADVFAAAALQGTDIAAAIPALAAALDGGYGLTRSAANALRNAAAKGADISPALSRLRRCGEDQNPLLKTVRETAQEALRLFEARQQKDNA